MSARLACHKPPRIVPAQLSPPSPKWVGCSRLECRGAGHATSPQFAISLDKKRGPVILAHHRPEGERSPQGSWFEMARNTSDHPEATRATEAALFQCNAAIRPRKPALGGILRYCRRATPVHNLIEFPGSLDTRPAASRAGSAQAPLLGPMSGLCPRLLPPPGEWQPRRRASPRLPTNLVSPWVNPMLACGALDKDPRSPGELGRRAGTFLGRGGESSPS